MVMHFKFGIWTFLCSAQIKLHAIRCQKSPTTPTLSHTILLNRLEQYAGIRGTALNWFASYLEGRTFSVEIDNITSSSAACTSGVPQGSVLGPLLFSIYLLPLPNIFHKLLTSYHCYADDIQLYLPVKSDENTSLQPLFDSLGEVKSWLADNFLQLNDYKTEVLVFGRLKHFGSYN